MPEEHRKHWMDLCKAIVEAKDSNEVLRLVQKLNEALDREEQSRREGRNKFERAPEVTRC